MYYRISEWIDSVMKNGMPKEVISVCFNLYDDIGALKSAPQTVPSN
ncbi:hypothetical protein SAMN04487830_10258 [Pseudobutyrivibrio sp. OR37]|nr:hypothetical protein [Pseudobutyrivibrio sp. OR37]SFH57054.1 hypothetical protein SAMN04487830_10258 [Pseudobutyrivibrio sp. OR37]